jgi:hypothetical protein
MTHFLQTDTLSTVTLNPVSLAADQALTSWDGTVTVYPTSRIAFIEGSPASLSDLRDIHVALVQAAATVNAGTHPTRTWETRRGIITVRSGRFNVEINGDDCSPATVAQHASDIQTLLIAAGDPA